MGGSRSRRRAARPAERPVTPGVVGWRQAACWVAALAGVALSAAVARGAEQAGGPLSGPPRRVPQLIEFRVWFSAVDSPVQVERLARWSLPVGGVVRVAFVDGAADLARAVSDLLASGRQAVTTAARGQEGGVGTLLGSLGHPVRLTMGTRPILPSRERAGAPDLRETAFSLELMPLSVDRDGRILTRVTLQAGEGPGPRSSYSHTLWLKEHVGAPLALFWGHAGRSPDASAAAMPVDQAVPVYVLAVSARPVEAPGPDVALVRVAEVTPLEGPFFELLGNRDEARPAKPPAPKFQVGVDAWLSRDAPVWRLDLTQPLGRDRWALEADVSWAEPPAEVEVRTALRYRLVHELALLAEGSARLGAAGELSPTLGLGLAEITHPLARLSLQARYLPVVYTRPGPSAAWQRQPAAWEAGALLSQTGWSLSLQFGRSSLHGHSAGASLSVEFGRGFSVRAGYRMFPDSGRSYVLAGLSYRP